MKNVNQWETTTTTHEGFDAALETSTASLEYVVYTTTNTITGETYTGVFSYDPATRAGIYKYEHYIGQGLTYEGQAKRMKPTAFTKNVAAYGYHSFSRVELFTTTSETEAYNKEAAIVDEAHLDLLTTLNQRTGGKQGKLSKASRKRRSVAWTGAGNPMAKTVMNTATGRIYGSIKEASEKLGITYNILKYQLKTNNTTNITFA